MNNIFLSFFFRKQLYAFIIVEKTYLIDVNVSKESSMEIHIYTNTLCVSVSFSFLFPFFGYCTVLKKNNIITKEIK